MKREIIYYYPITAEKIKIIPNPVDYNHFQVPSAFDKNEERIKLGYLKDDFVIIFSALGDFSRKGLDVLFDSLVLCNNNKIKILIVGGARGEIKIYTTIAKRLKIENQVNFVGFQNDVRPYFWCGDIFSLPSTYETFSLVVIQAAAAGLPILATKLYGVEEYIINDKNGWIVERDSYKIAEILEKILTDLKSSMTFGQIIKESAQKYDVQFFHYHWKKTFSNYLDKKISTE